MEHEQEKKKKEEHEEDLMLGDIVEYNIKSNEELEDILDKKGISSVKEKIIYLQNYQLAMGAYSLMVKNIQKTFAPISTIIKKYIENFKPITKLSNYISEFVRPLNIIYTEFQKAISKIIPPEWTDKLLIDLKEVKQFYMKKLIKSHTLVKYSYISSIKDEEKQLIIFAQFILYLHAIFENFTKKLRKIFKKLPDDAREKLRRKEITSTIKEFYDPIEMNYGKLCGYLYSIADNMKHEDAKFYKRFSKYSFNELIDESTELYLDLKLFIRKALTSFFIIHVRLYHLTYFKE